MNLVLDKGRELGKCRLLTALEADGQKQTKKKDRPLEPRQWFPLFFLFGLLSPTPTSAHARLTRTHG